MAVVVKLKRDKVLYKLLLVTIKYIPFIIGAFYALNTILCCLGIDAPILSIIAGTSLLTWIFMFLASVVFRFCIYHRMFLWYILTDDSINITDYYIGIPTETHEILSVHCGLIGILLFLILYIYVKGNKGDTA